MAVSVEEVAGFSEGTTVPSLYQGFGALWPA